MERRRILGLDALRGLAASAVMLHHHGQYYDVAYGGRVPLPINLEAGHFGVELFFIISGFVILMTIERKRTVRDFAISRFTRLMPAYLAALVLATVMLIFWPMPPALEAPTFEQFLANLTMAPTLLGQNGVDMPYWTLTYELVFYIYMALLLRLGLLGSIEWVGLGALAVALACRCFLDMPHHLRAGILLLVFYSHFFVIGICLYRIREARARPLTYVVLILSIAMSALGGGERAFNASGWLYLTLTAAFALLVWYTTQRPRWWLTLPPLTFLGRISYPLYLVHVALGFEAIRLGIRLGWSTLQGVIVAGLLSLAAATILHYLVEVPGARWSRAKLAWLENAPA